jgi:hypothetical protein
MKDKQKAGISNGPGSARLTLFGRSFVRFEEETDKGGGGGGTTTAAATAAAGGDAGGKSGEKTYTAAEVEGIVKDRLARAKPKSPEPDNKTAKKADNADATWVFDLQDAIDAQTEERAVKVPQGLKKRMRAAFAAERPDDPNAWVGTWLDDVGLVKKTTTDTTTTESKAAEKATTDTKSATAATKPISDKGTATVSRDVDEITNPNDLTAVDIERIYAKHGEDKGNELIATMAKKWLESVKIVPDRGPRR